MASAERTEIFDCSVEEFYKIITDYEKYPEFLAEVKDCQVVEESGNQKVVEYHISLVKNFSYRLRMTEESPNRVSWVFDSGDLFKVSTGSWALTSKDGKCQATYNIEAKFKIFVPGPISKALVNTNLPSMMASYHKRVKELYG